MTDQRDPNDPNNELEGFDSFEEPMGDDPMLEDEPLDDAAMDADFQDLPEDEVDADVFGEGEPAEAPAKKKTNWFNIGVAVVAIAVAGGLVWSKLGPTLTGDSGGSAPMMMMNQDNLAQTNPNDANAAAQQALAPTSGATPQGGLLDDPEKFATLAQNAKPEEAAPDKTAAAIPDPFAGLPQAPTQAAQAEAVSATEVPMPAPISAAPAPEAPAAAAPVQTATPLPTPPLATTPTEPAPVAIAQTTETTFPGAATPEASPAPVPVGTPLADPALESKVEAMENRLEALDEKITNAVERLENAAPADDSRLASIQTALERLESRLDKMASTRSVSASRSEVPAPAKQASAPKKTSRPKAASPYDAPYSPPSQAVNVSAGGSASGWELRGATNGRAIIAKGSDIREVGVGDTVPGMGQITGVAQVNGLWVVQGTMNRLSQ